MSQGVRDLLIRGIAAAKAKDKAEARFYLEWVLRTDASRPQKARAWLWLSEISSDPAEKRNCLEEALAQEPTNALARRGLAILDGRLDPADIIDPNRPPPPQEDADAAARPIDAQRFVCQKCGGKLAFQPDGRSLRCAYCDDELSLLAAIKQGTLVQEHDFAVALATAKGHTRPVGQRPFVCQGCGASFLLARDVLSLQCAFCGSAHVVEMPETRQLIPPEGLIPFAVSEQAARRAFHGWIRKQKLHGAQVTPLHGLYLPVWTFDLVGEIRWQCYTYEERGASLDVGGIPVTFSGSRQQRQRVMAKGSHPVYEDDVIVAASHKLPADLTSELDRFVLGDVVPYDEGYLADWPAEVYEIAVSDASLVARRKVLEKARKSADIKIRATRGSVQDLQLNTANVLIESYKLLLLPVWLARYRFEEQVYHVVVNGQTGQVQAQQPRNWLQKFVDLVFR